jgi:poly-gamma-glutamate synthesis protein (capsule biosynthesis protein)
MSGTAAQAPGVLPDYRGGSIVNLMASIGFALIVARFEGRSASTSVSNADIARIFGRYTTLPRTRLRRRARISPSSGAWASTWPARSRKSSRQAVRGRPDLSARLRLTYNYERTFSRAVCSMLIMGRDAVTLFLCGDVMTGRGIDQILSAPSDPGLFESYIDDARAYVRLAEQLNGPIPRHVDYSYVWGVGLGMLAHVGPAARIVNLETSVTASEAAWPGKGINYRMHPKNVGVLTAARLDVCVLANNHVIDWGFAGLDDTLETLHAAGIRTAGAGADADEAAAPAVVGLEGGGHVLVYASGSETSGIPSAWAAGRGAPGVNVVDEFSVTTAQRLGARIARERAGGDIAVVSVHWGPNWGYSIPREQRAFAHALIDSGAVDVVHGHSSHHAKGIEVYRGKPIIYGCGDFVTDYEGISGHEEYRGDLSLAYFPTFDGATAEFSGLRIVPMRMLRFALHDVSRTDAEWLQAILTREGKQFSTRAELDAGTEIHLRW